MNGTNTNTTQLSNITNGISLSLKVKSLPYTLLASVQKSSQNLVSAQFPTVLDVTIPTTIQAVNDVRTLYICHFGKHRNHNAGYWIYLTIRLQCLASKRESSESRR